MDDKEETSVKELTTAQVAAKKVGKVITTVVTIATEIAVVAFLGSTVGAYMNAKTIVADCQRVNLAKVGDLFVNCTVVEPKKDLPTQPPR